ncbi:MAG: glycine cleavage system protein GcvH [Candidatus Methanomethylicia archaeon]|jgi:glycine cleavage system H protein|nr:glycine cleavage system protein GcvH [Candidatus Methanomethylicia archaeon]
MSSYIKIGEILIHKEFLYSKTHEWIAINEKPSRIGITDYAQRNLHDIVYIELPKIGELFNKGSTICTLESIKAVAEVFAPVDCKIVEVNSNLIEHPELVNRDPYGDGWLVKVEVKNDIKDLMNAETYAEFIKKL